MPNAFFGDIIFIFSGMPLVQQLLPEMELS